MDIMGLFKKYVCRTAYPGYPYQSFVSVSVAVIVLYLQKISDELNDDVDLSFTKSFRTNDRSHEKYISSIWFETIGFWFEPLIFTSESMRAGNHSRFRRGAFCPTEDLNPGEENDI